MYTVNEIFTSVQGEGHWVGRLSTFIRLQGCPVKCHWCDSGPLATTLKGSSSNTWGPGVTKMTVVEILKRVEAPWVVITGGEPVIWDLDPLLQALHDQGLESQLETSGWGALKGQLTPTWITVSPKPNLHYRVPTEILSLADEFKFVVDEELDLYTLESYDNLNTAGVPLILMPEGCPPRQEMVEKTLQFIRHNPNWIFGDRLQYRIGVR